VMEEDPINREAIVAAHRLIGSHIRRTPIIEVDGTDFGLISLCTLRRWSARGSRV